MFFNSHFRDNSARSKKVIKKRRKERLFPGLDPLKLQKDKDLKCIINAMLEPGGKIPKSSISAGYTYFGQFLAHDITFSAKPSKKKLSKKGKLNSLNTPKLNLDLLYGGGPATHPYIYSQNIEKDYFFHLKKKKFKEKISLQTFDDKNESTLVKGSFRIWDVPRKKGVALIPDPRNDEHILLSQLHTAFLLSHNNIISGSKIKNVVERFKRTKKKLVHHYHWLIINDYLKKFIKQDLIDDLISGKKTALYNPHKMPFIPIEFSAAAFRFGHSLVRNSYSFNRIYPLPNVKKESFLALLEDNINFVDWRNFFQSKSLNPKKSSFLNKAKIISPWLVSNLEDFPITNKFFRQSKIVGENLARLNLKTGFDLELPSGQSIAHALHLPENEILQVDIKNLPCYYRDNTPLWLYILYEAYSLEKGQKLGPVGERIIAEVIIGIIKSNPNSYLNTKPSWSPKQDSIVQFLKNAGVYKGAFIFS